MKCANSPACGAGRNFSCTEYVSAWRESMAKDILALMESRYESFSKGQRRITKYIEDNFDKAAFMTAAKLGKPGRWPEPPRQGSGTVIGTAIRQDGSDGSNPLVGTDCQTVFEVSFCSPALWRRRGCLSHQCAAQRLCVRMWHRVAAGYCSQ